MSEDWLEKRLRGQEAHIDDDGFSNAVMAALPARPRRALLSREDWIMGVALMIAFGCVAVNFPLVQLVDLFARSVSLLWLGSMAGVALALVSLTENPLRRYL